MGDATLPTIGPTSKDPPIEANWVNKGICFGAQKNFSCQVFSFVVKKTKSGSTIL
jgi:hypothetical protein